MRLDAAKELLEELLQRNQQAKPMDAQLEAAKQSRIRCQKAQEAADAGLEQARTALEQAQAAVLLAEKAAVATAAEFERAKADHLRVLESCQAVQRAQAAEGVGAAKVEPATAVSWDPSTCAGISEQARAVLPLDDARQLMALLDLLFKSKFFQRGRLHSVLYCTLYCIV